MTPSFSDLQYFQEVCATRHVTRAAERLGIAQPTLSLALKRLERSVGTPLLVRRKTGVEPTKAGIEFRDRSLSLLDQWASLVEGVSEHEAEVLGHFTLGVHPSVAQSFCGTFTAQLLREHPRLSLRFVHDLSRKITEQVISHRIDFGIAVNPIQHPDLVIRQLTTDQIAFWVARKPSHLQALGSPDAVIVCDTELQQTRVLLDKIRRKKLFSGRTMHSGSLEFIRELTRAGAGVGVLPGSVVSAGKPGLRLLDSALPIFKDSVCLVYRGDAQRSPASRAIVESIKHHFSEP